MNRELELLMVGLGMGEMYACEIRSDLASVASDETVHRGPKTSVAPGTRRSTLGRWMALAMGGMALASVPLGLLM